MNNILRAPSGRAYYRTENGCVMCWYDRGIYKETLISDSNNRFVSKWSDLYKRINKQSTTKGYGYIASDNNNKFSDPVESLQNNAMLFTDSRLDICLFSKDPNTSKYNRSLEPDNIIYSVLDKEYTIPNIQTLVRIYCDAAFIDSLDPTDNNTCKLSVSNGGWFRDNTLTEFCWSSTEMDFYYMWVINSRGLVGGIGKNDLSGGIIPIKELI